ncbi:hypothetical protein KUTeg_016331 [Tegillarca granosa]|uniref:NADAR domain-containing protein n=1 Tax=Tegillarca granosa TaxID=220873 RepID=A0ABQ9EPD9_TEGGR|nr:hypothetical protein KUTeg_016331 [Tegillarca granosa]
MFDTKYFNSLNERSSNGGLNSTISSTPDRPRFRIPSYKELTGRENEVEEDYSNDKKEDFELFWRIQSPFSQFHPAKFEVHGLWYNCAEQFFMHQKACECSASPVDNTWGIGLAKDNQLAWSRKTWRGQNFLGYTLTDVRNELMRKEGLIPVEKGGTNSDEKEGANSDEKGGENS